jgi:hypothetical protein
MPKPLPRWIPNFGMDAGMFSVGGPLNISQKLGQGDLKARCQHFKDAQTGFPTPVLQFRDVDAANS